MKTQRSSPRFRFAGSALFLLLLVLVLPALREGDSRLYFLSAAVPAALLLSSVLLGRLFSMDRMILTLTLFLSSLGIAALAFSDPDGATSQALRCAAGLALLVAGAVTARSLRASTLLSALSAFLGLLVLAARFLAPASGLSLSMAALVLLLVSFSSMLSSGKPFAALALGLAGTALLLASGEAVQALAWSLAFLLLFWASDGSLLLLLSGAGLAALMLLGAVVILHVSFLPAPLSPAAENPLLAEWTKGLSEGVSGSLLSRLGDVYGPAFSGLSALLFLPLALRGAAVAGGSRTRFHAVLAMGCTLLTVLNVLPALLSEFGVLRLRDVSLPFFSLSLPELCSWMFLQGLVCGISGRNDEDLEDDVHLAMLAK